MDYIYLLTNNCLPGIVKIGKSPRPKRACAEINKGGGVFGRWSVKYTWRAKHGDVMERQACIALVQYKHKLSGGVGIFQVEVDKAIILVSIGLASPLPLAYQKKLRSIEFNRPVCGYSDQAITEQEE